MSPSRSRPKVLVRDLSAADDFTLLGNAISTNFRLRHLDTFGSVPRFGNREGGHSTGLGSFAQCGAAGFMWTNTQSAERRRSALRMDHEDSVGSREWLAVCVLDLLGPDALDGAHHSGRHWHEIELLRHLAALGVRPGKKLECFTGGSGILRLLMDQDECRRRHWPRLRAGLIAQNHTISRNTIPVGVCGCSLERLGDGRD